MCWREGQGTATTLAAKYIASSSFWFPFKCFLCFVHFQAPPGLPPGQLAPNSFNSSGKNLALRRSPQAAVQASKAASSPRPPVPFPRTSVSQPRQHPAAIDAHYNGITPIVGNSIVEENNVQRASPTLDHCAESHQVFKSRQSDKFCLNSPHFGKENRHISSQAISLQVLHWSSIS